LVRLKINVALEDSLGGFLDATSLNSQFASVDRYRLDVVRILQYSILA